MKTKRMFIVTLLTAIIFGYTVNASKGTELSMASFELRKQIQNNLGSFKNEDISGLSECNTLDLFFEVSENGRIEVLSIKSENKDLVEFIETRLKKNSVIADKVLKGHRYLVRIRFLESNNEVVMYLNGDQTHQGRHIRIFKSDFAIQRFELYDYK